MKWRLCFEMVAGSVFALDHMMYDQIDVGQLFIVGEALVELHNLQRTPRVLLREICAEALGSADWQKTRSRQICMCIFVHLRHGHTLRLTDGKSCDLGQGGKGDWLSGACSGDAGGKVGRARTPWGNVRKSVTSIRERGSQRATRVNRETITARDENRFHQRQTHHQRHTHHGTDAFVVIMYTEKGSA